MKIKQALKIINANKKSDNSKNKGYMVSFEKHEGNILRSDYFPDKHAKEKLIPTEDEAWELAWKFSNATGNDVINIYVIDETFSPVKGYYNKTIRRYVP